MFTRAPLGGCASAPTKTLSSPNARVCAASAPDSSRLESLEQRGLSLAHSHTERRQPVPPAAAAELVQQGHDEPRAGHAQGMAERDRAAIHVHLLRIQAQLADDDEALRSEGLVQLDEVEVRDLEAGTRQRLAYGRDRPDSHHSRIDTGNR